MSNGLGILVSGEEDDEPLILPDNEDFVGAKDELPGIPISDKIIIGGCATVAIISGIAIGFGINRGTKALLAKQQEDAKARLKEEEIEKITPRKPS
jgi:hypothetical protein